MIIQMMSAGKSEVLAGHIPADLYLDCRVIRNPFRDPVLGGRNGDDPLVQKWIEEKNASIVQAYKTAILLGVETSSSRNSFKSDQHKPFRVCFFCLAGVHRSRGMKNVLAKILKGEEFDVEVL